MNYILDAAQAYLAAGICPVPIVAGTKRPDVSALDRVYGMQVFEPNTWRFRLPWLPSEKDLVSWFGDGTRQVGVATGAISGGLVALDFDHVTLWDAWSHELTQRGIVPHKLPVIRSHRGHHVYFRTDTRYETMKLRTYPGRDDTKIISIVDIRGEGGYLVAPPSRHPSGIYYVEYRGALALVPHVLPELANTLVEAAQFESLFRFTIDDWPGGHAGTVGLTPDGIMIAAADTSGNRHEVQLSLTQAVRLRSYFIEYGKLIDELQRQIAQEAHDRYVEATEGGIYLPDEDRIDQLHPFPTYATGDYS